METDVSLGQHRPNTVGELCLVCLIFPGGGPEFALVVNKSD